MIANTYGRVIGITSLTAYIGIKNISAYSASKGGMSQFLMSIAVELAKYNITVNMIAPGRIVTNMTDDLIGNQKMNDSINTRIPMARFGIPSDLTGAALFLASETSSYMTGQSIIVDGGWLGSGGNIPG
jgi:NAD(P)-dependent dehydrogenase (short-subunit alcohol dehydrogenase family)